MSAAPAASAGNAPPAKRGLLSRKFVLVIAMLALLLAVGGGGAFYFLKKRGAADGGTDAQSSSGHAPSRRSRAEAPTFLPLEPFTVNLADKDQDRYAQIGITLQVDDEKVAEQLKAYMPAVRNNVLLILANKTSAELLERAGKEQLAGEIMRAAVRPLGIDIGGDTGARSAGEDAKDSGSKAQEQDRRPPRNPVQQVLFTNIIVQ